MKSESNYFRDWFLSALPAALWGAAIDGIINRVFIVVTFDRYRQLLEYEVIYFIKHQGIAMVAALLLGLALRQFLRIPIVRITAAIPLVTVLLSFFMSGKPGTAMLSVFAALAGTIYLAVALRSKKSLADRFMPECASALMAVGVLNLWIRQLWFPDGDDFVTFLFFSQTVILLAWIWRSGCDRWGFRWKVRSLATVLAICFLWLYPTTLKLSSFATLIMPVVENFDQPEFAATGEFSPESPNLLLVSIDTLRADALGLYGEANDTPALDALGNEGVVFERAYAQASYTVPSVTSFIAAKYPSLLKFAADSFMISDQEDLLAMKLSRKGYDTKAIIGNYSLSPSLGLYQGMAKIVLAHENLSTNSTTDTLTKLALEFLDKPRDRPFFLWLHYYDPHAPYDPPASQRASIDYDGELPSRVGEPRPGHYYVPEDLKYIKDLYLGEVRHVDDSVEKLMDALKRQKLYDNTFVAVVSDHGEEFYEHGSFSHGHSMYEEVIHVPMFIKGPGILAGTRVKAPVEIMGLMPTLEALLKLEPAPSDQARQGVSLASQIADPDGEVLKKLLYAEEIYYGEQKRCLRIDSWKLIQNIEFDRFEMFNLNVDTLEQHNLYGLDTEQSLYLRETTEMVVKENDRRVHEGEAVIAPDVKKELEERLKSLGYIK